eukprot:sb/3466196/
MLVFATLLGLASLLETFDVHAVTPDPDLKCELVEVGGYLHEQCFLTTGTYYKCPLSNSVYQSWKYGGNCHNVNFDRLCPSDPGFYQACGHAYCIGYRELGGTPLLCGSYICSESDYDYYRSGDKWEAYYHCKDGFCKNTNLNMVGCSNSGNEVTPSSIPSSSSSNVNYYLRCDGKCNDINSCSDESYCNGVRYGILCGGLYKYIHPKWICNGYSNCYSNGDDEIGCDNWTVADHTTCQHQWTGETILIQDNMRCFHPDYSACRNGQDQTNCSDPERVVMQCLSQGFPTTISIWGYCQGYQLCDDNYNNVCINPEHGCNIHKGQLCDGNPDCNNGGDETCKTKDLTKVWCIR